MINRKAYNLLIDELTLTNTTLVAVSKTKPAADIEALHELGQRDFGENYVQELVDKQTALPTNINWHFIGHLQGNKVKYIAPFIYLIHGVDSYKLLQEINKQARKNERVIDCLLQIHIAQEETKFGFDNAELEQLFSTDLKSLANIHIKGFMGMASFSDDKEKVRREFKGLKSLFDKYSNHSANISPLAIEEGSTMVRIGSLLFGSR
jgi:pyridoxal phosphate enzyme (YggS family)